MSDAPPPPYSQPPAGPSGPYAPPGAYPPAGPQYPPPAHYPPPPAGQQLAAPGSPGMYPTAGPVGKIRGTGACIALSLVTLGFYGLYWYYQVHTEMKNHSRTGLGGGLALVLSIFVGFVMPYITSAEVGGLYEQRGQRAPVSGVTGLWYFPGMLLLIGPIVWFVKTNGALNAYWRSLGAV